MTHQQKLIQPRILKSLFAPLVVLFLLLVSSSTSALYANSIKLDCDNPEYITVEHEGKGTITYKYCRDENNKVTFAEFVADKTTIEDKDLQEQLLKAFMEAEAPARLELLTVPEDEDVLNRGETEPRFPGCEDMEGAEKLKKDCAREKFLEYLFSNLIYPERAKKNNTQGTVILQFVVFKDGSIRDINVLRGVEDGCSEEAIRVIHSMNTAGIKWIPATLRGNKINTKYTLPIKFRL